MQIQENPTTRSSHLAISSQEFRALGAQLIDRIANVLDSFPERPVTRGESPSDIRQALDADRALPQQGADPAQLLNRAADLLFNAHPRFWGYVTSPPAPI